MPSGSSQKHNHHTLLIIGGLLLAAGIASGLLAPQAPKPPQKVSLVEVLPEPVIEPSQLDKAASYTPTTLIPKLTPYSYSDTPDFANMDVKAKKSAFAEFIRKQVVHYNEFIVQERAWIHRLKSKDQWSQSERKAFKTLTEKYRFKRFNIGNAKDWQDLLVRVDTIPEALAIAQGANESAWGTSRFAKLGNNYFGQWCFRKGCGIKPNSRTEGMTHEVRKFNNAFYSVKAYIDNLNTHPAYRKLRKIRAQKRSAQLEIKATDLTIGLEHYSERGMEYVETLNQMIRFNKWEHL